MSPHGGQNWVALVVTFGVLLLGLRAWLRYLHVEEGGEELLTWLRSLGPEVEVDHEQCSHPECDQVICACRKPAECVGTTTLGCPHGDWLCWDCRLGCSACFIDEVRAQDVAWERGR